MPPRSGHQEEKIVRYFARSTASTRPGFGFTAFLFHPSCSGPNSKIAKCKWAVERVLNWSGNAVWGSGQYEDVAYLPQSGRVVGVQFDDDLVRALSHEQLFDQRRV